MNNVESVKMLVGGGCHVDTANVSVSVFLFSVFSVFLCFCVSVCLCIFILVLVPIYVCRVMETLSCMYQA